MTVPTVMSDLFTATGSNYPQGGEAVFPNNDDFLRAISAILRRKDAKGTNIASGATVAIGGSLDGDFVDVTHSSGTTAITSFGTVAAGIVRTVRFVVTGGTLSITHNATSMILPAGYNIAVANNDMGIFRSLGSGNWVCEAITGSPVAYVSKANTFTAAQTISTAVNTGLTVRSSTDGVVRSESTGGYASFQAVASGANAAYLLLANAGGATEVGRFAADGTDLSIRVGASASPAYTVDQSRIAHTFTGGTADTTLNLNASGGATCTVTASTTFDSGAFSTNRSSGFIVASNNIYLRTTSGGNYNHLLVDSSGNHQADSAGHVGTLYNAVYLRGSAEYDASGVYVRGWGAFSVSYISTGKYQITATPASIGKVMQISVIPKYSAGAHRVAQYEYVSDRSAYIYIGDSNGTGLSDRGFIVSVGW